jgi:UDP-N-acetylglucosamine diphosphorylase/glucosamine-1-phosphate N-acetyltransferase
MTLNESSRLSGVAVIILAAGLGKRMQSDQAKVMHQVNGRAMVLYVIDTAVRLAGRNVIVVVGHQADAVRGMISGHADVGYALQSEQLGTGHAVRCALPAVPSGCEDVVILCGDVPLITLQTVRDLVKKHREDGRDLSLLAVEMPQPEGYGRILLDDRNDFCGIVEESDATPGQKKIRLINAGIYCVKKAFLLEALPHVAAENAQGEYYLTDIIEIGYRRRARMGIHIGPEADEVLGINTLSDLARVERRMRSKQANMA